jgi:excinuclease ABC subunit A
MRVKQARLQGIAGEDLDLPRSGLVLLSGAIGSGKSAILRGLLLEPARRLLDQWGAPPAGLPPEVADHIEDPLLALPVRLEAPPVGRIGERIGLLPPLLSLALQEGELRCPGCSRPMRWGPAPRLAAALPLPPAARVAVLAPLQRAATGGIGPLLDELRRAGFSRVRLDGEQHLIDELGPIDGRRPHDLDVVVDRHRGDAPLDRRLEALRSALKAGRGRALIEIAEGGQRQEVGLGTQPWCPAHPEAWPTPTAQALDPEREGSCGACRGEGCATCGGSGLAPLGRQLWLRDRPLSAWLTGPLSDLAELGAGSTLLRHLQERLAGAMDLGLGHLPLARRCLACSSGELRLAALAAGLHSAAPGLALVVERPSLHLDPEQVARVAGVLAKRARQQPIFVEDNHPALRAQADHSLERRAEAPAPPALPRGSLGPRLALLLGARGAGLPELDLELRRGELLLLSGPSGSGKSALGQQSLLEALRQGSPLPHRSLERTELLPLELRAPRPTRARMLVASALELWAPLREMLAATPAARVAGLGAEAFSLHQKGGRCGLCEGSGQDPELSTLGLVEPCPLCLGGRFEPEQLAITWKGLNAAELLALRISEALPLLGSLRRIGPALELAEACGLGHLRLGQPLPTLSLGEAHRLDMMGLLARVDQGAAQGKPALVVLDEPAACEGPAGKAWWASWMRDRPMAGWLLLSSDPAWTPLTDRQMLLTSP